MKKGASQAVFVIGVAVLTILGIIILFSFIGKTKTLSEDLSDYYICKEGNLALAKTKVKLIDAIVPEREFKHCRTENVKVTAGKEYETIANKMALCWDEYLEGKEEVFDTQDNNYCAFCSILEFDDKTKKLDQLSKYMVNNKIPGRGQTYIQYLSSIEAVGDKKTELENIELKNSRYIDTSKNLAIIFAMYKDAYPSLIGQPEELTTLGGVAGGGIIGTAVMGLSYVAGLGLCTTGVGCSIGAFLITGAGGISGYLIGSDRSADWSAKILAIGYNRESLSKLGCTRLEGTDSLKVQKN